MKKRKILLLIPFAGLVLSGCTFQDGVNWLGKNIYEPVKNWIVSLFNGGKKDEGGGGGGGGNKPVQIETGTLENPISVQTFRTQCDKLIDYTALAEGASETNPDYLFYVKADVISSTAMTEYGEIQYLNMRDIQYTSLEITGHYTLVDESVEGNYSAANSLANKLVVVKGYACLFHNKTRGKTYQLSKLDNNNKPTVMSVEDKEISRIVSVTGPEQVVQGTTIPASNVSVKVEYATGGEGDGQIQSIVADTETLGQHEASVTIKGWSQPLHFTYEVIEALPGATKTFSAQDLIEDPSAEYTGGSVKLETHSVDPVLTVSVEAGDDNSGKIYKDSNNGFQIRLYKSGNAKFVATVVPGYVITAATAITAPKGSQWWVAGTETDMSIAASKTRATIGGSDDRVVYSATITYAPDVAVESVTLEEETATLEMQHQGVQLHATVLPENAGNKDLVWESKDTSKVEVDDSGFITPVAVTSEPVEVVVTSAANPEATDSCMVTVTEATNPIHHIVVTGEATKTTYNNGEAFDPAGLGVEVYYEDETHEPAESGVTWTSNPTNAVAGEGGTESVVFTAHYQGFTADKEVTGITVNDKSSLQVAYEAAIASSSETEAMTFEGTIVAKRADNEWFIQDGAYGIEYYGSNSEFAVGKRVQVVSTLQKFNGLPETKTITSGTVLGDGQLPNPVVITTVAEQTATKYNVLANVVGTAKEDWSSYSASANKTLNISTSDGDIAVYLKKDLFSSLESKIQAVKEGDTVTFTNVVTSIYNSPQICFCVGSDLTVEAAPVKTIIDIVSVTGPSEAVGVGYTFKTSDVTVVVEYDDHSTGNGKVTGISASTESSGDNQIGTVTVEGWSEPLEFTYNVSSSTPTILDETAAYTGTTTTNMDGTNQASLLGVSDSHLSLVGTKENGGTNNVGLNKSGQIRLYKGESCALTISISGGTIVSLDIALGGTIDGLAVGGTSVSGIQANKTSTVSINGTSAVLTNNGTSGQTYILSIVIHYTLNA